MKRSLLVVCALAAGLAASMFGQKVDREGKLWLDAKQGAVEVNVDGIWNSKDWGKVTLSQKEGARELVGRGDGWDVLGAVSGKKVYLIFSHKGRVAYSAELTAESPNLLGGAYSKGLLFPGTKTRPMNLSK